MTSSAPVGPPPSPASGFLAGDLAAAHAELAALRARARRGIAVEALGVAGLLLVAFAIPTLLTDRALRLEWAYRAALLATFVVVLLRVVWRRFVVPSRVDLGDGEMALAVERRSPEIRQALISSLQFDAELQRGVATVESPELKAAVVRDVRSRLAAIPFGAAIDAGRVRRFAAGIAAAVVFFGGWTALDAPSFGIWAQRLLLLSNVDWPRYTTLGFADTGELRLPQGDPLTLRVTVDGPVPDKAFVRYRFATGDEGEEPLSRTGEREFTWTIDAVIADAELTVSGGDAVAITTRVHIVERPRVDGLAVVVTFPDYMGREPLAVPAGEGELRLPKGARLAITAQSQKELSEAFVLFGNDQKHPLTVAADRRAFAGELAPEQSGVMVVDVIDRDRLGAGAPPKLVLRVGDDKPPLLEFRLRGIGTSITAHARIPGELKIRDDFGLTAVAAGYRVQQDKAATGGEGAAPAPLPEPAFADAVVAYDEALTVNSLRLETSALVDLRQWNRIADEAAADNPIRPGMLFSLRFAAKDNFGPGAPHDGFTEVMTFRVVTRDQLVEELRRRQLEQRQELEHILEEEQAGTLEVAETVNPTAAGDRQKLALAKLKAQARRQQALGRRVAFVADAYQRLLWEYENNRLIEPNQVRQIEGLIPGPLAVLAKDAFPATSRQVAAFADTGDEATRLAAVDGYKDIEARIRAVLKQMEDAERLAALLEELKSVIKLEDGAIRGVKQRVEDREADIFGPRGQKSPPPNPPEQPKKQ
ncbi:MAG: hypothetical protein JNN13_09575 [Planctomycetes bacterium]|nr:hypothetical protein [Planctomycetota bacterium]